MIWVPYPTRPAFIMASTSLSSSAYFHYIVFRDNFSPMLIYITFIYVIVYIYLHCIVVRLSATRTCTWEMVFTLCLMRFLD